MSYSYTLEQLNDLSDIKLNHVIFNQNAVYNNSQLIASINSNTTINANKTCSNIDITQNPITIVFNGELSNPSQINALITVLSNYVFIDEIVYKNYLNVNLNKSKINSTVFERIAVFNYEGSIKLGSITNILFLSYIDSGVTNYSVRIYDKTNNNVIKEGTFTNTNEYTNELTSLNNIPETRSLIEVLIKKTGGATSKYVYVNSITFYF